MENFVAYNPVQLHFGKGVVSKLGTQAQKYGNKALVIYGRGSVKRNGSYQDVINQLQKSEIQYFDYSGIKSNPVVTDVRNAIELINQHQLEFIIAIGGGSVIDSAKVIAVCAVENLDPWSVMKSKLIPRKAMPLISVLTLAATGTEMNAAAVLQNPETNEKTGYVNPLMFPKQSYLDPVYTFSVSPEYTAYGIVDLIAHAFESYFAKGDSGLADRFVQVIVQEAFRYASLVLEEPENYEYRANIMLQSTCALNGITAYGRLSSGDWGVHDIGHTLSYLYDVPHGASLSIAYPAWLKLQESRIPERISKLGMLLFNTPNIEEFRQKLISFFKQIHSPVSLAEIGITNTKKNEIINLMKINKVGGMHHKLSEGDYTELVDLMM